jgi:hypothetical protein
MQRGAGIWAPTRPFNDPFLYGGKGTVFETSFCVQISGSEEVYDTLGVGACYACVFMKGRVCKLTLLSS